MKCDNPNQLQLHTMDISQISSPTSRVATMGASTTKAVFL